MLTEKINVLREKLEKQILDNEPYDDIYKTSSEIDKLLTAYYKEEEQSRKKV